MDTKTCSTCKWYYEWFGSCCNGNSPFRADIRNPDETCDYWVEADERDEIRKEVCKQLG